MSSWANYLLLFEESSQLPLLLQELEYRQGLFGRLAHATLLLPS